MYIKIIVFFLVVIPFNLSAQINGKNFSITVNAVYTTSAKIYLNPNSSDILLRNSSFPIGSFMNPQVELRFKPFEDIFFGLSTEYMRKTSIGNNLTVFARNRTVTIPVEDGFKLIPIEFTAYYLLPFSSELFHFVMGGGAGYYFGEHIRKFGDAEVTNAGRKFAYGIHVILSMDYFIRSNFSLRGEMKFRDPQFRVTNKYNKSEANLNGEIINITQKTFDSKINIDGVSFILGVAFHF